MFKEYQKKQKKKQQEEIDCRSLENTLKDITAAVTEICTEIRDILKNAEEENKE